MQNFAEHYCAAGMTLTLAQRYEQAEMAFRAALKEAPSHPRARWGLAHALLGMGRYAEGWPLLRARFEIARDEVKPASNRLPEWQGEPLRGKTLVVTYEQGFGDQIMLARFLPQIRETGAQVMLAIRPPLKRLLEPLADHVVQIEPGSSVATPPYDYWTHFFSLPERLGVTLETLPTQPYLRAPTGTAECDAWRGKIGLFWRTGDEARSLPEDLAQRLLSRGMVSLHPEDSAAVDFADTARMIDALDLGPVDEVANPQSRGSDEDKAEVAIGGLVVSGGEPAAVLEL